MLQPPPAAAFGASEAVPAFFGHRFAAGVFVADHLHFGAPHRFARAGAFGNAGGNEGCLADFFLALLLENAAQFMRIRLLVDMQDALVFEQLLLFLLFFAVVVVRHQASPLMEGASLASPLFASLRVAPTLR